MSECMFSCGLYLWASTKCANSDRPVYPQDPIRHFFSVHYCTQVSCTSITKTLIILGRCASWSGTLRSACRPARRLQLRRLVFKGLFSNKFGGTQWSSRDIWAAQYKNVPSETMRAAKAQTSLRMRAGWSGPSLSAYRINGYVKYIDV